MDKYNEANAGVAIGEGLRGCSPLVSENACSMLVVDASYLATLFVVVIVAALMPF